MPGAASISWRRILFVRTDRLGETLLTLPAVLGLKAALPGSKITLLVHPGLRALIQRVCGIDEVWEYPPGQRQFWLFRALQWAMRFRRGHFDAVFISNPVKELHVAARLSGIPVRIGYGRKWGGLLTRRLPDERLTGNKHEVESNRDLVCFAGVPVGGVLPVGWNLEDEEKAVASLLKQQRIQISKPFVIVHPYASHPKKEWLPERYVALISGMQRHSLPIVIVGRPAAGAFQYASIAGKTPVVNLVGQLTLTQLAALLKHASVLVSSDSGPVHLAAAVGAPTVALFGTTDVAAGPGRWGPWGNKQAVVWKPSMEAITVDEILGAVLPYVR